MALNLYQNDGRYLSAVVTAPAAPVSGDPVMIGQIPGVALTDEGAGGNAATYTSVDTGGVYLLNVEGVVGAGNSAVVAGDILYYDTAATVKINKDVTNGVRFGYALGAVDSAGTGIIPVKIGY